MGQAMSTNGHPINLDSQQIRAEIRQQVEELATWTYDDDGPETWLPIRPDVGQYVTEILCEHESGPLSAGNVGMPEIVLMTDGTLNLFWIEGDNRLILQIPCKGIVCAERSRPGKGLAIRETYRDLEPHRLRSALDALFTWLQQDPEAH